MAIMATDTGQIKLSVALVLFTLSPIAKAIAGEIEFTPKLELEEIYTDNFELTANSNIDSLVSQVGLSLDAVYSAQYLDVSFSSKSLYATYSHDHELDNDYHSLNSEIEYTIWPNGITLFGRAGIDNRARNIAKNSLANIVSADTVRVEDYAAGLAYSVNNSDFNIDSSVGYINTKSEDNIGNRDGFQALLNSTNGQSARYYFWDISGDYQDLENNSQTAEFYQGEIKLGIITDWKINPFIRYYDEDNQGTLNQNRSLESNSIGAGIRWAITPRLYLDLSYNDPISSNQDIEGDELSNYVDASISWQPTTRTKLTASSSQRFFGNSYAFDLEHRNRRLENRINYVEQVEAFTRYNYEQSLLGAYWCPTSSEIVLSNCFIEGGQNINFDDYQLVNITDLIPIEEQQYNLSKRFSWGTTLNLPRTTFGFGIDRNRRINLDSLVEDEYFTSSVNIKRKVSGHSDLTIRFGYTKNHFQKQQELERLDRYRKYDIEYNKKLNARLNFVFGLSYIDRVSTDIQYTYEEQQAYLRFTKEF